MNEAEFAVQLANKVLDDHTRDPDGDLTVLARQLIRTREQVAGLERVIFEAICFPSAGLQDFEIRRLHAEINTARNNHELRLANARWSAASSRTS
jgi:hypothetical protein